jgi:hypothetical protein
MDLTRRPWGRLGLGAARISLAGMTATGTMLLATVPAHAVISGSCTGTGYSTPYAAGKPVDVAAAKAASANGGTTVDFKKDTDWYVPSYKDYLAGQGESPTGSMGAGFANVAFFGFEFPVVSGKGHGTTGKGGPLSAAELNLPAPLKGRPVASILTGYGRATVDPNPPLGQKAADGPCSGNITVHFQDVTGPTGAASTVVGQASLLLLLIGLVGLILTALRKTNRTFAGRFGGALVGAISGLIFGIGLGGFLSQLGVLDMASFTSLVVPIAGVILGILVGWFGGRLRALSRAPA